eukprot:Gb_24865 [translate_table: standard]
MHIQMIGIPGESLVLLGVRYFAFEIRMKSKGAKSVIRVFKSSKKNKEKDAQVHPIIPYQLSQACQIARPYRPSLTLKLETIKEEDPSKTPLEDPTRTPLYFAKGHKKRFRFQRYAKLSWKLHARRIHCRLSYVLRFLRRS